MYDSNQFNQPMQRGLAARRRFCKILGAGLGAGLIGIDSLMRLGNTTAQEPVRDSANANVQVGLAAYSFKKQFAFMKGKPQKPADRKPITMFDFIDYCANQKCAAELTSYFFPPTADDDYFRKVKRHAFLQGVPIVGTAIGNNFTVGRGDRLNQEIRDAKKWIDNAAIMGAPHVRFFAGTKKQLDAHPGNMAIAIEALQACCDYAAQKGVFVGVENHGQLTSDQVLEIVKGINSEWFGVNLDSGNFISDDPYADITKCVPFAVNVQLKVKMKRPDGEIYDADLARVASIIKQSNYRGYVVLEFEEDKPFEHVPGLLEQVRKAFE